MELQASIQQSQTPGSITSKPLPNPLLIQGPIPTSDLLGRLDAVTAVQKETMARLEKLESRLHSVDSLERTAQQRQAGLGALQQMQTDHQAKLGEANQCVKGLLVALKVPDDIATMDVGKGLKMLSLEPYWPYFEAIRERENLQTIAERLHIRLLQE